LILIITVYQDEDAKGELLLLYILDGNDVVLLKLFL